MKKKPLKKTDGMRDEYDFSKGVRGKYYQRAVAGTNLVLIEPELAEIFPDGAAVNDALRTFIRVVRAKTLKGRTRSVRRVCKKSGTVAR